MSDIFGVEGRKILTQKLPQLPPHTREVTEVMLAEVEALRGKIEALEEKLQEVLSPTKEMELVNPLPGVGFILAAVIVLEVEVSWAGKLASYPGLVPRAQVSGGRGRHGKTRADVNPYLKWAFVEAANVIARHAESQPYRHVNQLYLRLKAKKGYQKAAVPVGRHLAEATWWVLEPASPIRIR